MPKKIQLILALENTKEREISEKKKFLTNCSYLHSF